MEERMSWGDAFGTAWRNLTGVNNEGSVRIIRFIFFAVFLLGTAWAVWNYMEGLTLVQLEEFSPTQRPSPARADDQRLKAMISQVEVTSQLRMGSPEAVDILERTLAKYPFRESVTPPEIVVFDPTIQVDLPPVIIDYPPGITLRAIMIMGKQHIAVMDIPGVGSGMIVKAGDTFMQKKGRVVRIAPEKVVVNWGGKNWDIAPSF